MTIADALSRHAAERPDHPAIVDRESTLTYRALDRQVGAFATQFRVRGIADGDIVGLCLPDTAEHLVALYALARLGAVALPMDHRWTAAERCRVATFFGAKLALTGDGDTVDVGVVRLAMDGAWRAAVAETEPASFAPVPGDRPFILSLSSGTTGRPKGPLHTHAQTAHRFVVHRETFGMGPHDRYLSVLPLYFGGGRGFAMGTLALGGTVELFPPPYEPQALVAAIATRGATIALLVPTILRRLCALPAGDAPLLHGLRLLVSTGAALHPDERDAVRERLTPDYVNFYGSTEGAGATVLLPDHDGAAARSVGQPVFQTEIEVVGDDDRPLAPGEIGRIRYRSPATADGFYNDPDATAEAFRDGWFYPGDLGYLDRDRFLFLVGRSKDVIIRGGANIYPAEIEATLLTLPGVRDAAVVGQRSRDRGEEVAAFVIADDVDEDALIAHCRANLAGYKVPRTVALVDDLPRNSTGKVDKANLAARLPELRD